MPTHPDPPEPGTAEPQARPEPQDHEAVEKMIEDAMSDLHDARTHLGRRDYRGAYVRAEAASYLAAEAASYLADAAATALKNEADHASD